MHLTGRKRPVPGTVLDVKYELAIMCIKMFYGYIKTLLRKGLCSEGLLVITNDDYDIFCWKPPRMVAS